MPRNFFTFRTRRPEGGFRLFDRRRWSAIGPSRRNHAGFWDTWPSRQLKVQGRDRLLRDLEGLSLDDAETLLAFADRYGRFGCRESELSDGDEPTYYGETLPDIVLELSVWHGARALRADLDARRSVDPYVSRDPLGWQLRLPFPAAGHAFAIRGGHPLAPLSVNVEPPILAVGPSHLVNESTSREAAEAWLDHLVTDYFRRLAPFEQKKRVLGSRIETTLGVAWFSLATGPAPRRCVRPDCGTVFTPSIRHKRGDAAYCGPNCARWGQRHGYVKGRAPKERRRKKR